MHQPWRSKSQSRVRPAIVIQVDAVNGCLPGRQSGFEIRIQPIFLFQNPIHPFGQALLNEAVRLLHFVYLNADAERKNEVAIDLLRLLLEPFRPKQIGERPLARSLMDELETYYRRAGRKGSATLLRGRLLWLEGQERSALRMFQDAMNAGKESSGGLDWIWLLRWGTVLADKLAAKQVLKRFQKLAQVYGVFSQESAPRTNCLVNELRYQDFKAGFIALFKPFPKQLST